MLPLFTVLFAQAQQVANAPRPHRGGGGSLSPLFVVLVVAIVLGVAWKLAQLWLARQAVDRLSGDRPHLDAIADSAKHGRAALVDLFRLLTDGKDEAVRLAAGSALASLWFADELIPEEERALVTRGFSATWTARRAYPRDLSRPIPVAIEFGVSFLEGVEVGVKGSPLEWSSRVEGSDRASLESFSPWRIGTGGKAEFEIDPRDYPTNGPHRRALHARVRTIGLTSRWEHDLPKVAFSFEFASNLESRALLAQADDTRTAAFADCASLVACDESDGATSFLALNREFALKSPPRLRIRGPIPCDLAHAMTLEVEGSGGSVDLGRIVVLRDGSAEVALEPRGEAAIESVAAPGDVRVRVVLTPDVERGWADPAIRSVWPGTIATEWFTARTVRR